MKKNYKVHPLNSYLKTTLCLQSHPTVNMWGGCKSKWTARFEYIYPETCSSW